MRALKSNWLWLTAVLVVTVGSLAVMFAPAAAADSGPPLSSIASQMVVGSPDERVFNQDLTVGAGQVIRDNVAVFNGDVVVKPGGAIEGNLSVVRGDVVIGGTVQGDLAVVGGDVELQATARIEGDVSVVGGKVRRDPEAYVGGNFVGGPDVELGDMFNDVEGRDMFPDLRFRRPWYVSLFWRLLQAVLWTLVITGLVLLVLWLAPKQAEQVASTAQAEPALSFAVGLIVGLVVLLLAMGLMATLCLAPAALLLFGLLFATLLVGWAATAILAGRQIHALLGEETAQQVAPLVTQGLAAALLTGLLSLVWALVPCVGWLVAALLAAPGLGAVIVHLARRSQRRPTSPGFVQEEAPPPSEPEAPASAGPTPETATPDLEQEHIVTGEELGLSEEERALLEAGAQPAGEDDFTRLRGIGPAFDRRLKEAGVTTFAQLAALTPEEVAEIIGWPPERVIRDQLLEQAAELAQAS